MVLIGNKQSVFVETTACVTIKKKRFSTMKKRKKEQIKSKKKKRPPNKKARQTRRTGGFVFTKYPKPSVTIQIKDR